MAREKGSRTGRCQGYKHLERARIERLLAAGASIKGTARKFSIDYHALRRHWINHVSAEARAAYIAGAGKFVSARTALLKSFVAVALEHKLSGPPDVDFRYHSVEVTGFGSLNV